MAERRMFAKTIIDSDAFLDMPSSARLLYYDLSMRADDEGFVNNPKKIMRFTGASQQDIQVLIANKFIIPFADKGIVVIKHWFIHNYIRKDMFHETKYKEERDQLTKDENNAYTLQPCNEPVTIPSTQVRLELGQSKVKESKSKYGEYSHVRLTDSELQKLTEEYGETKTLKAIKILDEYIETSGKSYKSHYLVMKKWCYKAVDEQQEKPKPKPKNAFCDFDKEKQYDKENADLLEQILNM